MAKSTKDRLQTSNPKTLPGLSSVTFSQALEDGLTHSGWLVGPTTDRSGQALVLASHSVSRERAKALTTTATFGPLFGGSSLTPSENLQSSLESRLQARMAAYGSPEYDLTWKRWDMQSGPPICALRAYPRPISGRDFTGWVSPTVTDHKRGTNPPRERDTGIPLTQQVGQILVGMADVILGWSTPTAITDTGGAALCKWGGTRSRQRLKEAVGNTVLNGALNPEFPLWLMGYPTEWLSCADLETPSCHK